MQTKSLWVRQMGWQRIARNMGRFGWQLDDAVQQTETRTRTTYNGYVSENGNVNINPHTTKSKKIRIHLSFVRYDEDFENIGSMGLLEFFYNLFFFIRSLVGFVLPFTFLVLIPPIGPLVGGMLFGDEKWANIVGVVLGILGAWLVLIILENILSRIAGKILKLKI